MTLILALLAAIGGWIAYAIFGPSPINPGKWTPPKPPSLSTGSYARNTRLKAVQRVIPGDYTGPEDIAIDRDGRIYTGVLDGRVFRFNPDGSGLETIAHTGGRPLGLDFDHDGNLIIADAYRGLLKLDAGGTLHTLADRYEGQPLKVTNNFDITPDGTIYFTDSSTRFYVIDYEMDLLEFQPNGRLFAYDPAGGSIRKVLDGLYFPNGVALSPDGSFLAIAETWKYRLLRYWLTGDKAGTTDILVDNLPGFPDNLTSNRRDTIWIALASGPPTRRKVDPMIPYPAIRKLVVRLPHRLRPKPVPYGFILGVDANGTVVHNLQDPDGGYHEITAVREGDGCLWLGSLTENAVGKLPWPDG